jgi:hypothetical protein
MDARLARDQKRLRDYYQALLRETGRKKGRKQAEADPEKIEAKKRAVELELRRKLGELHEQYAMQAALVPVAVVRLELPVVAVDLAVYRKHWRRQHTVYWNPFTRQFEPMACSRCGAGAFAVAFANETVEPLCQACGAKK